MPDAVRDRGRILACIVVIVIVAAINAVAWIVHAL